MNMLKELSRDTQVVLGGSLLYVILSFLDWQQVCASFGGTSVCGGASEWHGVGVIGGLLGIVLLVWEAGRVLQLKIELGGVTPGLISVSLVLLLLLFTIITFLSHSAFRHWPEYTALALSIVITAAALRRAREEGVEMPDLSSIGSSGGSGPTGGSTGGSSTGGDPESGS